MIRWPLLRRRPAVSAPRRMPVVRMELVGREHAGKSILLDEMSRVCQDHGFRSGLQLRITDPRNLAVILRQRRGSEAALRQKGRETTIHPETWACSLCEQDVEHAAVRIRDAIGQILSHTTPHSPAEQQSRYEQYLNHLAGADVLWMVVPCIPASATAADISRFKDDLHLHSGYVQAALARRENGRPCVLAVVLNRLDTRYARIEDAQNRLSREILPWLRRQVEPLAASRKVGAAAIFPVTALGFGTTVLRTGSPHHPRSSLWLSAGENEWLLKPGHAPSPYNLRPLLAWSVLAGLVHQEAAGVPNLSSLTQVCRQFREDLRSLRGWQVSLKDF